MSTIQPSPKIRPILGLPLPVDYQGYTDNDSAQGSFRKIFADLSESGNTPPSPIATRRLNVAPGRLSLITIMCILLLWGVSRFLGISVHSPVSQDDQVSHSANTFTKVIRRSLPADSLHYYFAVNSGRLNGQTIFEVADSTSNATEIEIILSIAAKSKCLVNQVRAFSTINGGYSGSGFRIERGGGIWPCYFNEKTLWANMTIRFPADKTYAWTESRAFDAKPYSWSHVVQDLPRRGVSFQRLSLMSYNGDINVHRVKSDRADAYTRDGNISGYFDVPAKELVVQSVNGRVDINHPLR